ncbi:hypothetical protein NWF32_25455 [Pseudomonas qingdaonensis]|nr:hypothetical protein [Pseudomonas qingdaonensis]
MGGNSKHAVVVASEDGRYRLTLQDGEVSLYTDEGDYVHMKRGRLIEVVTDDLVFNVKNKVRFETPLVEMTGDQHVDGGIKAEGDIADHARTMREDRDLYNKHDHGAALSHRHCSEFLIFLWGQRCPFKRLQIGKPWRQLSSLSSDFSKPKHIERLLYEAICT